MLQEIMYCGVTTLENSSLKETKKIRKRKNKQMQWWKRMKEKYISKKTKQEMIGEWCIFNWDIIRGVKSCQCVNRDFKKWGGQLKKGESKSEK